MKRRVNNRKPIKCECGMTVMAVNGIGRGHLKSTVHRHSARIRALLSQPCMTLELIGERLSVTRERVRQIAKRMGVDTSPGARWSVCVFDRQERRRQARIRARLGTVLCSRLDALDTEIEFFYVSTALRLRINNSVCAISFCTRAAKHDGLNYYYHFGRPYGNDYQYVICVTGKTGVYVVPADWPPASIFIPVKRSTYHSTDRDWEQWREAWYLLAKADSAAA